MKLIILQPEGLVIDSNVESVTLPGRDGSFTLLDRHAPLISVLDKGIIKYRKINDTEHELLEINSGFVKVKNDLVTICIN